MIIDTSAIIAILAAETDAHQFKLAVVSHDVKTSAASYLEASIVLDSRGSTELSAEFDRFLSTGPGPASNPCSPPRPASPAGPTSNSVAAPVIRPG